MQEKLEKWNMFLRILIPFRTNLTVFVGVFVENKTSLFQEPEIMINLKHNLEKWTVKLIEEGGCQILY